MFNFRINSNEIEELNSRLKEYDDNESIMNIRKIKSSGDNLTQLLFKSTKDKQKSRTAKKGKKKEKGKRKSIKKK